MKPIEKLAPNRTRKFVYSALFLFTAAFSVFMIWQLRSLILPIIIGALGAYMCYPLLDIAKRFSIPRGIGIILIFVLFFILIFIFANQITSFIPDDKDKLLIKTRLQYRINEKYQSIMGIQESKGSGNMIYTMLGKELNITIAKINTLLALDKQEQKQFLKLREGSKDRQAISDRYYEYFKKNINWSDEKQNELLSDEKSSDKIDNNDAPKESFLSTLLGIIELWIVIPFVFLFLLIDDGRIKKAIINALPNKYFEVSCTVFENINRAIGNYLRGTLIECSLVGLSFIIMFLLIGFEAKWAVLIGIIAGITNAIPFLGPVIGLSLGTLYAFITEGVSAPLPFMNENNLIVGILIGVLIVRILDDAIFQPYIIGGAVHLHPLAVFLGIIGGSTLFGFAGLLLTIPAIVVLKEFISTLFRELRTYKLL